LTHQLVLGKSKLKKSTILYLSSAILGIILLALVLVGTYLDAIDALNILVSFSPTKLGFGFMIGGIISLTVGIVGIGRQFFRSHGTFLQAFSIPLISLLLFVTFIFAINSIYSSAPMFPLRSEITQVTVVDTSPLVLSVDVKAITSSDSRIDQAIVINSNNELAAETSFDDREWIEYGGFKGLALAVLPEGSEIALTLNFNATLPSGDYLVSLVCWHTNHGSSLFTIP
jgi:hypothetical protein